MISHYIFKKNNENFNIHLFFRNREINIYNHDGCWEGEEIAFGSWWDLTEQETKQLFNLLYLNDIVINASRNKPVEFNLPSLDINWSEVNAII